MLKQLKYFQSVVRLGSFSAAAEENFISQSAISQQVQSLERELGFALLVHKIAHFRSRLRANTFTVRACCSQRTVTACVPRRQRSPRARRRI